MLLLASKVCKCLQCCHPLLISLLALLWKMQIRTNEIHSLRQTSWFTDAPRKIAFVLQNQHYHSQIMCCASVNWAHTFASTCLLVLALDVRSTILASRVVILHLVHERLQSNVCLCLLKVVCIAILKPCLLLMCLGRATIACVCVMMSASFFLWSVCKAILKALAFAWRRLLAFTSKRLHCYP